MVSPMVLPPHPLFYLALFRKMTEEQWFISPPVVFRKKVEGQGFLVGGQFKHGLSRFYAVGRCLVTRVFTGETVFF